MGRSRRNGISLAVGLVAHSLLSAWSPAAGTPSYWSPASGDFTAASNWSAGLTDDLRIDNAGTATISTTYSTIPSAKLSLGSANGTSGSLQINSGGNYQFVNGTLMVGFIGTNTIDLPGGIGTVVQDGGSVGGLSTLSVACSYYDAQAGKTSVYTLNDGSVSTSFLGLSYGGRFNQYGGSVAIGGFGVPNSAAQYRLAGGSLAVSSDWNLLQGKLKGGAAPATLNLGSDSGGVYAASPGTLEDVGNIQVSLRDESLLILPAASSFAGISGGLVHVAGQTLVIPEGKTVRGHALPSPDDVEIRGSLYLQSQDYRARGVAVAVRGNGTLQLTGLSGSTMVTLDRGGALADQGTLTTSALRLVGPTAFVQSGGTMTLGGMTLNDVYTAYGHYRMEGGTASISGVGGGAALAVVGNATQASSVVQTGGAITVAPTGTRNTVIVGGDNYYYPGAVLGTYDQSGGSLSSGRLYVATAGTFTQAGDVTLLATTTSSDPQPPRGGEDPSAPSLHVRGQYTQQGGTLQAQHEVIDGTFTQTGGTHTSRGILIRSGGYMDLSGGLTQVSIASGTTAETGYVDIYGTLKLRGNASEGPRLTAATVTVFANGKLTGTGHLEADVVNRGILAPGQSPGELLITGDFAQEATGVLQLELGNSAQDHLTITGNATMDGTVEIYFLDGYVPTPGTEISLISAGGTWTGAPQFIFPEAPDFSATGEFDGTSGLFTMTLVPEPGSIAAALSASGLLLPRRRRLMRRAA